MFRWMLYWVWWFSWRCAVTLVSILTLQNIIHQEQDIWIETKPLMVGALLMVIVIRMWSSHGTPPKELK